MANSLSGGRENKISRRIQAFLNKTLLMPKLANFEENNTLVRAQSVSRPKYSDVTVSDYTANTDVTAQDITATQQLLTVDQSRTAAVKVDPSEQAQVAHDLDATYSMRISTALKEDMEGKFLAEVNNAATTLDAGNFGGSAGSPIDLSSVNADKVFADAFAYLSTNDVEMDKPWQAVVDPFTRSAIEQRGIGQLFSLGDSIWRNGYTGDFINFQVYTSNSLPASVSLGMATNPTADDTVSINGVTFTFKASPTNPGDVDVGVDAATSVDNLVAAINGGAGAGTAYIEISTANRTKLTKANVVATDNTTAIGLTAYGRMTLAETLTAVGDVFGSQTIKSLFMRQGAIDAVVQMQPSVQINKATNNLGHTILGHALYGFKTFDEGAERMLRVDIKA